MVLWFILEKKYMRKLTIILVLLTFIYSSCKGEKRPESMIKNFVFTIEFYPSFIPSSRFVIKKEGEKETISFDNIYSGKGLLKREGLTVENINSSLLDKDYVKFWTDTLFIKHIENQGIKKEFFQQFIDSLNSTDFAEQKSLINEDILDGITIYFRFQTEKSDNHFSFRCPEKSDSSEFKTITSLISLFENSFKSLASNNYIENLKGYFDYGLLVKHISENPLEYRFYSHLSSNEAEEFYKLIEDLPKDKPIIFDFSNFGGMGTMFYDNFEELIESNPNVYWIVNENSMRQMKEIGVKPNRIYKDRMTLLKKLKNKP